MFVWFAGLDMRALYPLTLLLIAGAAQLGGYMGRKLRHGAGEGSDIGTLSGATLGLLALMLGFSFSLALSRFDTRRNLVLEEANAIGSTANFALMLPQPAQGRILALLREYTAVRIGLGVPYDPAKLRQDSARSVELQNRLWRQATALTDAAPQSLPLYRFIGSLNEMNNIHESRVTALRFKVPGELMAMLIAIATVAMGFTGYHVGLGGARRPWAMLIMSATVAGVIMLIVDLDRPARGMIVVPVQPLKDAAAGLPPP